MPCPTCFLTRATELALRGDLHGSVQQHAFGPLMAISLLLWSLAAIRQRRLLPHPLDKPMPTWLPALALMALLGYWVLRLRLGFGVALAGPGTGG